VDYKPIDLSMPVMDGLALQQELKRRGVGLPIIFISGHGSAYESNLAISRGAVDFIEKPFVQSMLIEKIELALEMAVQDEGACVALSPECDKTK